MRRRQFLGATAAGAVAAACGDDGRQPVTAAPPTTAADRIAGAARVAGVNYTDAELAQLAGTVDTQLDWVRARRTIELPTELAPALTFDPVLPGRPPPAVTAGISGSRVTGPLPTSDDDIAFAPLTALASWLRSRAITSERLTELYLSRLRSRGGELACVATLTDELALEQARAADAEIAAGRYRGPLHGVPYGAKDLFDTAGVRTAWGAAPYRDRVPANDAAVVVRLRDAGAVLVAKLTLGALAYGDIWYGGITRNPWNPAEGSSGSSAGSACAVAAGLVGFALATETYASIVSPSMRCGTTGLRPTFGRVARTGAMPLCWSLDKIGAICRRVEDAVHVLAAIDGPDPGDPSTRKSWPLGFAAGRGARGRRIGFVPAWMDQADELDRAALATLEKLGAELVERPPLTVPVDALLPILMSEAAAAFEELTLSDRDDLLTWQADEAWPNSFRAARLLSAVDLVQADRLRRRVMTEVDAMLASVDALFAPSFSPLLLATNNTGHPSLTLRVGFRERKPMAAGTDDPIRAAAPFLAPHGATLWGRLYDEGTLCEIGAALEGALGVADRRPG